MKYEILGQPKAQVEFSDEYETAMTITLRREDGVTGDIWIVAGVPEYLRGESDATGSQTGYAQAWLLGDSVDMWCPESFRVEDEPGSNTYHQVAQDVIAACQSAAITAHRDKIRNEEGTANA